MKLSLYAALWAAVIGGCGCAAGDGEAKRFKQTLQGRSVTVYPAVVRSGGRPVSHDAAAATAIAAALGKAGARQAVVFDEKLTLSRKTSFNQGAMFKASLAAFDEHLKSHP